MSNPFWKRMASSRADVGAREALGAVRALAELGLRHRDWALVEEALTVIDDAMLPVKKDVVESPEVVGYGHCQDKKCPGVDEQRRLYAVDGQQLCVGCRKRRNKAQKNPQQAEYVERLLAEAEAARGKT